MLYNPLIILSIKEIYFYFYFYLKIQVITVRIKCFSVRLLWTHLKANHIKTR